LFFVYYFFARQIYERSHYSTVCFTKLPKKMKLSNEAKCLYFGVLIVLLFVAVMYFMRWSKNATERLNVGYPYAYGASSFNQGWAEYPQSGMSSGAYMRNLSQEMSQPLQGEYTTPSAMRVKGVEDFVWPEQTVGKITSPGIAALAKRARDLEGLRLGDAYSSGSTTADWRVANRVLHGGGSGEHLVSTRGEPDFWELPQELRSAQVRQAGARLGPEKFAVGGTRTRAAYDIDAYVYPQVY
jgi:hypothetical protein